RITNNNSNKKIYEKSTARTKADGKYYKSRKDVQDQLAKIYKTEEERVVCHKMHIHFGGGRSTALALIYDDIAKLKLYEPKYRQKGFATKKEGGRKTRKEKKNKAKKYRGLSKKKIASSATKKQNRKK
ncbi:hypothetical protein MXB_1116, partial [Myxobolus squamalis]